MLTSKTVLLCCMSLHYNRELLNTGNALVLKGRMSQTQRTIPNNWSQILWMTSFHFCLVFFLCAFYFNSRLINAASEMTFVGKLCVWDKRQNLHKLICVFHVNLVIDTSGFPVLLAAKGCCCRFDFFPLYSELQMLPQVVNVHQKQLFS